MQRSIKTVLGDNIMFIIIIITMIILKIKIRVAERVFLSRWAHQHVQPAESRVWGSERVVSLCSFHRWQLLFHSHNATCSYEAANFRIESTHTQRTENINFKSERFIFYQRVGFVPTNDLGPHQSVHPGVNKFSMTENLLNLSG